MGKLLIERFSTPEEVAAAAAEKWLERIVRAQGSQQHVAFSGGRISRVFFAGALERARKRETALDHIHFFWADERCVPPNHDESNFLLAYDQLLGPARVPTVNIHRIRGEEQPEAAAQAASEELKQIVPSNSAGLPVLDLVFLGMGEDGHIASLFPPVESKDGIYLHVTASKPPPHRITLSYAMIESAKEVWVLVSGANKEDALCDSLAADGKTPLAHVIKRRPLTRILTNI